MPIEQIPLVHFCLPYSKVASIVLYNNGYLDVGERLFRLWNDMLPALTLSLLRARSYLDARHLEESTLSNVQQLPTLQESFPIAHIVPFFDLLSLKRVLGSSQTIFHLPDQI